MTTPRYVLNSIPIPLLVTFHSPREVKQLIHTKACTPMFMTALFRIAKNVYQLMIRKEVTSKRKNLGPNGTEEVKKRDEKL